MPKHTRAPIFSAIGGMEYLEDETRFFFCVLVFFDDTTGAEVLVKSISMMPTVKARAERASSYRDDILGMESMIREGIRTIWLSVTVNKTG